MIDKLILSVLGSFIGVGLGVLPGSHINNIIPLLLSFSFVLSPINISILIVSIAVSQIITSYIPSIYLGAPSEDTSLSVLPGHKMLIDGRGFEAVKIMIFGGILSTIFTLFIIFFFFEYFQQIYVLSRPYVYVLIILTIAFMSGIEKKIKKIFLSLFIIVLSGVFGIFAINFPFVNQNVVLFPILSGMFGLSTLFISLREKTKIPKQKKNQKIKLKNDEIVRASIFGSLFGILVGFLPAIGVSQAAILSQFLGGLRSPRMFLATLSGIDISNEIFSIFSIYLFGNPRSGASVAIQRILKEIDIGTIGVFLGSILISISVSSFLVIKFGEKISEKISRINYTLLNVFGIIYLLTLIFVFSGPWGVFISLVGCSIGILSAKLGVKRSDCMGVLLIPSLLFFLGIDSFVYSILGI